jgi:hypothetical protein
MKQFTIRFETESVKDANAIFESLKTGTVINGIKVTAISDGDLFVRQDATENQLNIYEAYIAADMLNKGDEESFNELQTKIDQSWERDIAKVIP